MLEEIEQKLSPSIQIITSEKNKDLMEDQKSRLFQIRNLPCFCTIELRQSASIKNDIFNYLVRVLEDWNTKVEKGLQSVNSRAQLFRNQFIYTSLKKIMLQNINVNANLQKLYLWYCKNSSEGQAFITMKTNQNNTRDDDWDVRKTFRTNVSVQLSNYRRRQFNFQYFNTFNKQTQSLLIGETRKVGGSIQQSRVVTSCINQLQKAKDDQCMLMNLSKHSRYRQDDFEKQNYRNYPSKITESSQFKMQQQQIRKKRQEQQINTAKSNWKHQKARYQQHTSINFYNAKFQKNKVWDDNKTLSTRTDAFQHIKRRRLDKFFGFRKLLNQRNNDLNIQKVDGLNLMSNPFQIKMKPKRKRI